MNALPPRVRPRPGLIVRNPLTGEKLDDTTAFPLPSDPAWHRLFIAGDLIEEADDGR